MMAPTAATMTVETMGMMVGIRVVTKIVSTR